MANPVLGTSVVIEMLIVDTYWPILCGTDCTFNRSAVMIPITTAGSGSSTEVMAGKESWKMGVTGLTKIVNDTVLTFFYMLQTSTRRQRQSIRITYTDDQAQSKQITGDAYIGEMNINGPHNEYSSSFIEFIGTGDFTVGTTEPPDEPTFIVYADYWDCVAAQNYISGLSTGETDGNQYTLAATDEILDVVLENQTLYATTGTPGVGQYKFDTGLLRLVNGLTFDGGERMYVMWKRPV